MAFWNRKHTENEQVITILAPFSGEVLALEALADPVFSQKMVGDGVAVMPSSDVLTAPVAGTLTNMFPTGHAAGVTTKEGLEVLMHIGMDTVELKGEGFHQLASQGDSVTAGTPLIRIELEKLQQVAKSVATPVVITNMAVVEKMEVTDKKEVVANEDWILRVVLKRK